MSWEYYQKGEKPCETCTGAISIIPSIEVGHTFQLGDIFTKALNTTMNRNYLLMNCYGLGIGSFILFTDFMRILLVSISLLVIF